MLIADKLLLHNNMGIALRDQSPLREAIDEQLLQKLSEAKREEILSRYPGPDQL